MNNSIEYEDFVSNVRKSLYSKKQMGEKLKQNTHQKHKKVKFSTAQNIHNGQSTTESQSKSEKLKLRKATPHKRKLKRESLQDDVISSNPQVRKPKKGATEVKQKKHKKKQLTISFDDTSDSFDENSENNQLTPSKSELEIFQNAINKSYKRKAYEISDSNSEDDDSDVNFDLNTFFNSREISEFSESLTETHSGIDYEFVSDYAKDVQIIGSESLCSIEETVKNETAGIEEITEDISEDNVSQDNEDKNITSIAEKIQETVVVSDDNCEETVCESFEYQQFEEEEPRLNEHSSAEYHTFENAEIVVLKEDQCIYFHGLFTLKVLHGKVEVLGSILDSISNPVNLYSPRGSALLNITNVTECQNSRENYERIDISKLIAGDNLEVGDILVEGNNAAFLCSKLEDSTVSFLEKYVPQKIFPRLENDKAPQVIFEPTGNLNMFKINAEWDKILNKVKCNTKLMIAGGKGVGKSTLLRFAVNRLLNKFTKVRVLDLDPGQSEFAVPGCISIVTIAEPIFGPNFTHLKQTDRSLLSNINVAHDPKAYINSIKEIISFLDTLEGEYPILINYMGFVQGIGLNIIASAVKYIQPTDIIQIYSKNQNKNFRDDLTFEVIKENCKLFSDDKKWRANNSGLNYKLHKVSSVNDDNDGWSLEPRKSRELNVLAYFGQMMHKGVNSFTSHELPMYEIKLSEIKITNLQREEVDPAIVNANMVALCSLEEESNIFVCRGYGIVRGIDLECDKLVLVTPEQAAVLEDVYYLIMGSVSLPPSIYMTPDDVRGVVPYVMEGELVSLSQITKRSYLPVNKK